MSLYECNRCGVVHKSNGKPDGCGACSGANNPPRFHRIDDVDELLS